MISKLQLLELAEHGSPQDLELLQKYLDDQFLSWQPRPDNPRLGDEQSSFVFDQFDGMAVALGGNGSGVGPLSPCD